MTLIAQIETMQNNQEAEYVEISTRYSLCYRVVYTRDFRCFVFYG